MLIRSQDKFSLVNIKNGTLITSETGTISFHSTSGHAVILGRYRERKKSIEVLDAIQEANDAYERCKSVGGFQNIKTFQMPREEEDEQ